MKPSLSFKVIFVICLSFLLLTCTKDDLDNNKGNKDSSSVDFITKLNNFKGEETVITNVLVKVVNNEGIALKDVNIDISGTTSITDSKGIALLKNVNAHKNFIATNVSKKGYIPITKTIAPSETKFQIINITLEKPDRTQTTSSDSSTNITLDTGAQIDLTGNYITTDGTPYSGSVKIEAKHLSPNNENTYNSMPGALIAQDKNGNIKLLETFGMIAVNLYSNDGEALNITENDKATLTFPIATSQIGTAPNSIPLWYFNKEKSIWVEDGKAIKEGTNYVATVSHFSWWNIDVPIDLVRFCMTVSNSNNDILPNQPVHIIRKKTNQIIYKGHTNNNGKLCGALPENEQITIKIIKKESSCLLNDILYEADFSGYSNSENDISISVNESSDTKNYKISGITGNCNNTSVDNIQLELQLFNETHYFFPNADGSFSYNIMACEGEPMTLRAYDIKNKLTNNAIVLNFTNNSINVGTLKTCEDYSEKTYVGNLKFTTQKDIDEFTALGYTKIDGNLIITNYQNSIKSLKGFSDLTYIEGNLHILDGDSYNPLASISGFENLTYIGEGLVIRGFFDDLKGLSSLSFISRTLDITGSIKSLLGLENLTDVGDIKITSSSLQNLRGLEGLKKIGRGSVFGQLTILNNTNLQTLEGLENLTHIIWGLRIEGNPALTNLKGLKNLGYVKEGIGVYNNESLESLNGLDNLTNIGSWASYHNGRGGLYFTNNPVLKDLTNLKTLSYLGGGLEIINNDALTNLNGLNSITNIPLNLKIVDNDNLPNLTGLSNIAIVNGEVLIDNNLNLKNFTGLDKLTAFNDPVIIKNNNALKNFEGLEKLNIIKDDVEVSNNNLLKNFNGLSSLESTTGFFKIHNNNSLENFSGLEKLYTIGGEFNIDENQNLENLSGLNSLTSIDEIVTISNNASLLSLEGLNNLETINDRLIIFNNNSLVSLSALSNINTIYKSLLIKNNSSLLTLNGLENLKGIKVLTSYSGDLYITDNTSLTDFCALLNNFTRDFTNDTPQYSVRDNGYNPSYKFFSGEEPCKL